MDTDVSVCPGEDDCDSHVRQDVAPTTQGAAVTETATATANPFEVAAATCLNARSL